MTLAVELVTALIAFGAFLGTYAWLRRREQSRSGRTPPVRWGWLAAIVGTACLALIIGAATR